jgi:phage repressor protein C with HTH and peptisase S24 domain
MFKQKANTTCNNKTFTSATIRAMTESIHPTAARLLLAAATLSQEGVSGPSDLARVLGVSPQVATNWMRRGVSKEGMLAAQEKLGANPTWIRTGEGEMGAPGAAKHIAGENKDANSMYNAPVTEPSEIATPDNLDPTTLTGPQRIRAALGPLGLTAETLAGVAAVGAEVASLWLAGQGPEPTLIQAVALQNTYGVNSVWILKGKGAPGVAIRYDDEWRPVTFKNWHLVPVKGMAQLGDNGYWAEIEYGEGYVATASLDKDAYAVRCKGDSMRPRIKDGEYVVLEPNQPISPGDEVLVKAKDGRVMVKEFVYEAQGKIFLLSTNETHGKISVERANIEHMHYVGWIAKPSAYRSQG